MNKNLRIGNAPPESARHIEHGPKFAVLEPAFFDRPADEVARGLLGRKVGKQGGMKGRDADTGLE